MPGQVGAISNEREGLLAYLAQMRYVLRLTAYGLTPDQLRAAPTASPLTVGGLIKHCASTEESWIDTVRREPRPVDYQAYADNFRLADGESIEDVLAHYERVAERTEKTIAEIADLGLPLLAAVSNKDFVGESTGLAKPDRLVPSVAAAAACVLGGARVLRMHDVAASVAAARMLEAVLGLREPTGLRHNLED